MARRTAPPPPVAAPLFQDDSRPPVAHACRLSLSYIQEEEGHNPRTDYGEGDGSFAALVESIRQRGVLQSILVQGSTTDQPVRVIAGNRRVAACRTLGLETIPAIVLNPMDVGQATALALVENLQRRDLNPPEEAEGYQRLESLGWTQEAIGRTVGRSQSHVSRALSLLSLPAGTRTMLREGLLSASHGAELVRLLGTGCAEQIDGLAGASVEYDRSVAATRRAVDDHLGMERARASREQTAIPVDDEPAPAREYATSHKSVASTSSDALTRPADPALEVKPGYTPADAKAEYEAAQAPDPDTTTPVADALRAAREQAPTPEAEPEAEPTGWDRYACLPPRCYEVGEETHAALLAAGYEDDDEAGRLIIDDVAQDALDLTHIRPRMVELTTEQVDALVPLAKAHGAAGGFSYYGWADYVWHLVDSAIAGRPILSPECQDLLGKIAAHHDRKPEDQLLAMLATRWDAIQFARTHTQAAEDARQEGQVA